MLTREDVLSGIRDADDRLVADLIATGASLEEFAQAIAWLSDNEAAYDAGASPSGAVARIVALLQRADEEWPGPDDR